jgi:hypothetical protein
MAIRDRATFLNNVRQLLTNINKLPVDLNRYVYGIYPGTKVPRGDIFRGQKSINPERAAKAAEYLNTTVEDLLKNTKTSYTMPGERMRPQENTGNPNGAPSWSVTDDHLQGQAAKPVSMYVKADLAPLVARLEQLLTDRDEIRSVIALFDQGDGEVLRSVVKILSSHEKAAATALKLNVSEFADKIAEKEKLNRTISNMEKQRIDMEKLLDAKMEEIKTIRDELTREKKDPPGLRERVDPAEND